MQNKQKKLLTITDRENLSKQHVLSFKDMKMDCYQDVMEGYDSDAYTVCINSLSKRLGDLSNDDLKNYVVYFDEISSFLQNFTHTMKH